MKNSELARIFRELADLLEFKGENPFKLAAYRKAARAMEDLTEDVAVVAKEDRLRDIPGIGEAIDSKIKEYLETGKMKRYEDAKQGVPSGLLEMLAVPGLGPRTVAILNQKLGVKTLKELEHAARAGKIEGLPGFGAKKIQNILGGIEMKTEGAKRMLLGEALPLVERITAEMRKAGIEKVVPAGSLRRMKETVGDLDILAAGKNGKEIVKLFCGLPQVKKVLAEGNTKGSVIVEEGRQVDLRVVPVESFGAALLYFTGSKAHNIHLRTLALKKNLKVNEYGIFRGEKAIAGKTEESVYEALGMQFIPPELREDRGEIEAALEKTLPKLIEIGDVRGDMHVHTNWSDGKASIEDMAKAAKAKGYEYIVISDHSRALKVFGGLSAEEMLEEVEEIKKTNRKVPGIRLLTGAEVDIKSDGSLDLPDEVLSKLDFVTASVHSGFKQSRETVTARILKAIRSEHVDAIGHPTGRLIGLRKSYDVDLDAVITEAAKRGTFLEINAHPQRLDLNDQACRRAKELGAKMVISTDAHAVENFDLMRFGVATARRGWLEKGDVLNTLPLKRLTAKLGK